MYLCLSAFLCVFLPWPAYAGLLDEARRSLPTGSARYDTSGMSIRGGANLQTGLAPNSMKLVRGQSQIGGGCGAFNFATSFQEAFEEIPELLKTLGEQIASNIPMTILCYTSPTLCDLSKHVQAIVQGTLQAKYARCEQIQQAMAYAGVRLRDGDAAKCLQYQANLGIPIGKAMNNCLETANFLSSPSGDPVQRVNLLEETLAKAGASTETRTLAKNLLGEVVLRTDNGFLHHEQERPLRSVLQRYEHYRLEAEESLGRAVIELRDTGDISDTTLRAISIPGQPMPRAALDALVAFQNDPVRYSALFGKLATGIAIAQVSYECHDLMDTLAAASDSNMELTDEQRKQIEYRLTSLQRNLKQTLAKKEIVEQHFQPAIETLLTEYAAVQMTATQAGIRAPSRVVPRLPYGRQAPSGYGQ